MENSTIVENIFKLVEQYSKAIFQIDPLMLSEENIQELLQEIKDVSNLTSERCSIISLRISQHIYGVQFKLNKVTAVVNYLHDEILRIVAPELIQYKGMSWTHTENLAIQNNIAAAELYNTMRQYKIIKDSCYGQIDILKDIAKKIENIKYEKRI